MDVQTIVYILSGFFGVCGLVISGLLIWGVQKFISTAISLIVEIQALRNEMNEVKSFGPKIIKIEKEIDKVHEKFRGLNHLIKEY